jgi:hypothetical protein
MSNVDDGWSNTGSMNNSQIDPGERSGIAIFRRFQFVRSSGTSGHCPQAILDRASTELEKLEGLPQF